MFKVLENQSEQSLSEMEKEFKDYFFIFEYKGNRPGGYYGIPLAYADEKDQDKIVEMQRDYHFNRDIETTIVAPRRLSLGTVKVVDFEVSYA